MLSAEAVSGAAVGRDQPRERVGVGGSPPRHDRPSRLAVLGPSGRGTGRDGHKGATLRSNAPENHGNVRGGVTRGRSRAHALGSNLARRSHARLGFGPPAGFQSSGKHLDPSEAVALRGAAMEEDLRPHCRSAEGGLQSSRRDDAATRVLDG